MSSSSYSSSGSSSSVCGSASSAEDSSSDEDLSQHDSQPEEEDVQPPLGPERNQDDISVCSVEEDDGLAETVQRLYPGFISHSRPPIKQCSPFPGAVAGCKFDVKDVLVAVAELRRRHGGTLELAEEILFLIKCLLPDSSNIPNNFAKALQQHCTEDPEIRKYHVCKNDDYIFKTKRGRVCPRCGASHYKPARVGGNPWRPVKVLYYIGPAMRP